MYSSVSIERLNLEKEILRSMLIFIKYVVNLAVHPPVSSSLYKIMRMNSKAEVIYNTKSYSFY